MAGMNDLVSKVNVGNGRSDRAKEYAAASEWPKCYAAGCPLPTTIKGDMPTCTHHFKKFGREADCITEAIKEFLPHIRKHNEMIYWDVKMWRDRESQIMGWPVLPATRFEMDNPTMYLIRLRKFIDTEISRKSEELWA